ncbi:hypothetical protein GCM10010245_88820 [Streptomyces spectabilis]|nr:hypothetical protein GCM10010245_88820 [Streptomyces spectabilis]
MNMRRTASRIAASSTLVAAAMASAATAHSVGLTSGDSNYCAARVATDSAKVYEYVETGDWLGGYDMRETGEQFRYGQCIMGFDDGDDSKYKSGRFEDNRVRVENREVPVYRISALGTNMTFTAVIGTTSGPRKPVVYVRSDHTVPCPGSECDALASRDPSPQLDAYDQCKWEGLTDEYCEEVSDGFMGLRAGQPALDHRTGDRQLNREVG